MTAAPASTTSAADPSNASANPPVLRIGLVTDLHYADKPDHKDRCYRSSLPKLRQAVEFFNRVGADFAVELGDFIDEGPTLDEEAGFARQIDAEFDRFRGERHYVLGNHCVWTLTKNEFLRACRARRPYYAFDRGNFHFIVLDACYRADEQPYGRRNFDWTDACIPAAERDWLSLDLARTDNKTIVFVHHRLDADDHYGIIKRVLVRNIIEDSGKVLAVIQGHYHPGDCRRIADIHYLTLSAMVTGSGPDDNAYALLEVYADGSLQLVGQGRQKSHVLPAAK
jgi:alkaline phosphatase